MERAREANNQAVWLIMHKDLDPKSTPNYTYVYQTTLNSSRVLWNIPTLEKLSDIKACYHPEIATVKFGFYMIGSDNWYPFNIGADASPRTHMHKVTNCIIL